MNRAITRLQAAIVWRWKYRFRPSRYRAFLDLFDGKVVSAKGFFPEQKAIVEEALRLRKTFGAAPSGGAVESISVVIPHYNQPAHLGAAIRSVQAQTLGAQEIIVVDDLSSDLAAVKAIEKEFSADSRVRFIFSKNKLYAGGARQLGMEASTGQAVSFLDADDIMHPQRLELSVAVMDARPDCAFVITGSRHFSGEAPACGAFDSREAFERLIGPRAIAESLARYFARMKLSWVDPATKSVHWYSWGAFGGGGRNPPNSGSFTIRREIAARMKWPTPKDYIFTPYEDYEYCLLLHAATSGGYQIDLPLLYYRTGSSTNAPSELV
jgi:glycosyltransferase involved in cell wall biosynthesis